MFHAYFVENYQPEQIYLLKYENLKADLITELRRLVDFLGVPMNNENCVLESKEGTNKRKKTNIDFKQFFSKSQKRLVQDIMETTYEKLGLVIDRINTKYI